MHEVDDLSQKNSGCACKRPGKDSETLHPKPHECVLESLAHLAERTLPRSAAGHKEWVRVSPHPSQGHFFAADCAQCASVVRNEFAPAGASTFPVRDVLNGTMRP